MQISAKFKKIDNVLVSGGTHGNEVNGVYLVKEWEKDSSFIERDSFTTDLLLSNQRAVELNRRFVEKDLNRCFLERDLEDSSLASYEDLLAHKIKRNIQKKYEGKTSLLVDMHTTTSNMGTTLICDNEPQNLLFAAMVKHRLPNANIYCIEKSDRILSCLRASGTYGIGIELGPVPQGVLRHDIVEEMRRTIDAVLDTAHELNSGTADAESFTEDFFMHKSEVLYPDGAFGDAMIHKGLEDNDYKVLRPGDPIFYGSECGEIKYDGTEEVYPVFINEAAYYAKGLAFSTSNKETGEFKLLKD